MFFLGTQEDGQPSWDDWVMDAAIGAFDYGSFAPLVLKAVAAHDNLAEALMAEQIQLLSRQIQALPAHGRGLCLMGGLAETIAPKLTRDIQIRQVPALGDALSGALYYAQTRLRR